MEVFRLVREQFAQTLSGKGAAINGARWNSQGVEMIYTAINRSLAMAEVAVHFSIATMPKNYMMVTIDIPNDIEIKTLNAEHLPANWNQFPHPTTTQKIGNLFILENTHCCLKVPSVVTKGDFNILINPQHPNFKSIAITNIEQFPFDQRIFSGL
jgi:RES domain-containing protein